MFRLRPLEKPISKNPVAFEKVPTRNTTEKLVELQTFVKQVVKQESINSLSKDSTLPIQTTAKQNQLHILCQKPNDAKEVSQIISKLREKLGEKLYVEQLKEIDNQGYTPLYYVIQLGNVDRVKQLFTNLSSASKRDILVAQSKPNLVRFAVETSTIDMVEVLLSNINEADKKLLITTEILNLAIQSGNIYLVTQLIDNLPSSKIREILVLDKGIQTLNLEMVQALLSRLDPHDKQAIVCQKNKEGKTPLHCAIATGDARIVKEILKDLPDLKAAIRQDQILQFACQYGNRTILEMVVEPLNGFELYQLRAPNLREFENLIKGNPKLSLQDYEVVVKRKNLLFEGYGYFVGVKNDEDTQNRLNDFKACFTAIADNKPLPLEEKNFMKTWGLFGKGWTGNRYHEYRKSLAEATPEQTKEFKAFLETEKTAIAMTILGNQFTQFKTTKSRDRKGGTNSSLENTAKISL